MQGLTTPGPALPTGNLTGRLRYVLGKVIVCFIMLVFGT